MADEQLAFLSATELLQLIASKQVSPVELTELFLRRIDRLDPQLNAFLLVTHDKAMRAAKAADGDGSEFGTDVARTLHVTVPRTRHHRGDYQGGRVVSCA